MWDHVRKLFAATQEAKVRGYLPGRFSFNVAGGRCEACAGDGTIKIEMHFLPDVYVPCEVCKGKRYNRDTLDITFKDKNVSDVLDLSCEEALEFFGNQPAIARHMQTLVDVGLGYVRLGQPATTLSGGEAQRVKLASELAKRSTGHTIYILDEPTTGLHFEDIRKLLTVLSRLVDQGNTVLVIEHNLDVIKTADWVIDLGPEGGNGGGTLVCEGSPEEVAEVSSSWTGQFLKPLLAGLTADRWCRAPDTSRRRALLVGLLFLGRRRPLGEGAHRPSPPPRLALTAAHRRSPARSTSTTTRAYIGIDRIDARRRTSYSDKAPGQPFLAVPFYAAAPRWAPSLPTVPRGDGQPHALVGHLLVLRRAAACVTRDAHRAPAAATSDPPLAVAATIAIGFGTLLLPFSAELYGHVLATCLGVAAWAAHPAGRSTRRLLLAGALAGLAVLVEYQMVLFVAVLRRVPDRARRRRALALVRGGRRALRGPAALVPGGRLREPVPARPTGRSPSTPTAAPRSSASPIRCRPSRCSSARGAC